MTSPDPRVLDLTAFDRAEDRSRSDQGDLHMLRLALDLQLDALLLALGASAHAESRGEPTDNTPWSRWLTEDLDLARTLAGALVDNDVAPLPGLGGGLAPSGRETSLANLTTRYESMEHLLTGLLDRAALGLPLRNVASDALHRCRARLGELHRQRREAITAVAAFRTSSHPGEWLG